MTKPLYVSFYTLADSKNLLLIDKTVIASGLYPENVPCRIVSNFNDLDIMIEISPQVYQSQIKPRLDTKNNLAYCVTFDKGTLERPVQTPQNSKYWYVTDIVIDDDLSCRLMLHRDTLYEYWTGALYSNVKDTPVIILSETIPSQLSKNSGQKVTFNESIIEGDLVNDLFAYAWGNNVAGTDWIHKRIFVIDIVSNQADDTTATQYFYDTKAGITTYVTDYVGLHRIVNNLTQKTVIQEITTAIASGRASDMFFRIAKSPIEFPLSVLQKVNSIPVGGDGYSLDVTLDEPLTKADVYKLNDRKRWNTPSNGSAGNWGISMGVPFVFTYDVAETQNIELTMPFVGKVDLSNFIEYFDGIFTVGYVIDMQSGRGMCGIVKGDTIDCDENTGEWLTKFDVIIPIDTFTPVDWIEVQSNKLERIFNVASGLISFGTGNITAESTNKLLKDPTTVTPHMNGDNRDASDLSIYGRFIKWGVKYVCREKGVTNQGFRHTLKPLADLDTVEAVEFPEDYNIITVECVKRAWTGNDAIDSDIYNVLTQRGFVKNK